MRQSIFISSCLIVLFSFKTASAQKTEESALLKGVNFIETQTYTDQENTAILKLYARQILDGDKKGRLQLYKRLGIPLDQTVK